MRRWIIILGLVLFPYFLFSQALSGVVIDSVNQKPLSDVHVQLVNSSLGSVTDSNGRFSFSKFPSGVSTIRISAIGYTTMEYQVEEGSGEISIALIPSVILLNNGITVTALRSEQRSLNVSQSVITLTGEEVIKKNSRSTPEALMNETGIWVQKTNHGGGSPIIRGLVGNQILLMVDGIRLNNATYRYGPNQYLSTIDPGMIERIDAIRGSGSVLYGSDALGGVVQVLSKTPVFNSSGLKVSSDAMVRWMSANMEQSARVGLELGESKIAFKGGFSIRNFGDILAGGNWGRLIPTSYNERSGDAKLLVRTGSSGILTAAFQQLTQHDLPRYDQVVLGGYARYNFEPQTRQLSYVRWESLIKSKWFQTFRITASLNRSIEGIVSQKNNSSDVKTQMDIVNTSGVIAEIISQPNPLWNIQSGVEYYFDKVHSSASVLNQGSNTEVNVRGSYADGSTTSSLALYTNHQYDLNQFQFSAGARINGIRVAVNDPVFGNQKISPDAVVGNLGILFKINSNVSAFINSNTGFRAPNIDDMSKFGTVESGVFEIPSSGLSPEKSLSIETGMKMSRKNFSGALAIYRTNLSDLIDRVPATYLGSSTYDGRQVYQKQNVGEAVLMGFEADTEIKTIKSLTAFANLTYTHGENITKNEPMRRIPPLFGKLGLRYQPVTKFWMRAEWVAAGVQDRLSSGDKSDARIAIRLKDGVMPSWNIVNIYAGYTYKAFTLNLVGQNLFNIAYRVYASGVDGYGRNMSASLIMKL